MTSATDNGFNPDALRYLLGHAIEPEVAAEVGVRQVGDCLHYPYFDDEGAYERRRLLTSTKTLQPTGRSLSIWWPQGKPEQADAVLVCEGEADALAALSALPELARVTTTIAAIPGTGYPVERLADELRSVGVKKAFLTFDADEAGSRCTDKACVALLQAHIEPVVVELAEGKDLADCLASEEDGARWLASALADAEAASTYSPSGTTATLQHPPAIAYSKAILGLLHEVLSALGLVGNTRTAKLVYLAVTSRLLAVIVSLALKGPSAGGKSYTVERVLHLFPSSAFYALTAMSERALAYSTEPLAHRMLVLYEAAGMENEIGEYLVRSLLSEGCVRYETVERTKEGLRAKLIQRKGPTGLIVTTTRLALHPENETRMLSAPISDSQDQTKAVLLSQASETKQEADVSEWVQLQEWLETGPRQVTVPYALALAELIPPVAVRLRRDWPTVLALVRAHALLHRANRVIDAEGRIVATLDDYAIVRELVADLVAEGAGASISATMRQTVEAVASLAASHEQGIPQSVLAQELGLDRSSVSRRVRAALREGYLENQEERRGRPHRLVVGEPLPDEVSILPEPEAVGYCATSGEVLHEGEAGEARTTSEIEGDCCTVARGPEKEEMPAATAAEQAEADRIVARFGQAA